jgi:hypothetical protein
MKQNSSIVVTVYGHDNIIDKFAVNLFDNSNANIYFDAMKKLKFKEESWIFAKQISEANLYSLDAFLPRKFDIILELDNTAVQKC